MKEHVLCTHSSSHTMSNIFTLQTFKGWEKGRWVSVTLQVTASVAAGYKNIGWGKFSLPA